MDNMDVVFLAIDECLDEGYLLINSKYVTLGNYNIIIYI